MKKNKYISESVDGEILLLGCQLFSIETFRFIIQQTSAKWPRKVYALSSCQPAAQEIRYYNVSTGHCVLTSDRSALLQMGFCSCPTSSSKWHELLQILAQCGNYFTGVILSQPLSHLTINPLSMLLVYHQVGWGCGLGFWPQSESFTKVSWHSVPLSSIYTVCFLACVLLHFAFALYQVLGLDFTHYKNVAIKFTSPYKSCCINLFKTPFPK